MKTFFFSLFLFFCVLYKSIKSTRYQLQLFLLSVQFTVANGGAEGMRDETSSTTNLAAGKRGDAARQTGRDTRDTNADG